MGSSPQNRISQLRKARGWNQTELAKRLGDKVATATVSKLERGDRRLTHEWAIRFSKALNCEVEDLFGAPFGAEASNASPVERVGVIGGVKAGDWRNPGNVFWPERDRFYIAIPTGPKYSRYPRFSLAVNGVEMNKRYAKGDYLVCIRTSDLDFEIPDNSRVITRTTDDDGDIEMAVKNLRRDANGDWLWPESTDPHHQAPAPLGQGNVELYALVIGSFRFEAD